MEPETEKQLENLHVGPDDMLVFWLREDYTPEERDAAIDTARAIVAWREGRGVDGPILILPRGEMTPEVHPMGEMAALLRRALADVEEAIRDRQLRSDLDGELQRRREGEERTQ